MGPGNARKAISNNAGQNKYSGTQAGLEGRGYDLHYRNDTLRPVIFFPSVAAAPTSLQRQAGRERESGQCGHCGFISKVVMLDWFFFNLFHFWIETSAGEIY